MLQQNHAEQRAACRYISLGIKLTFNCIKLQCTRHCNSTPKAPSAWPFFITDLELWKQLSGKGAYRLMWWAGLKCSNRFIESSEETPHLNPQWQLPSRAEGWAAFFLWDSSAYLTSLVIVPTMKTLSLVTTFKMVLRILRWAVLSQEAPKGCSAPKLASLPADTNCNCIM